MNEKRDKEAMEMLQYWEIPEIFSPVRHKLKKFCLNVEFRLYPYLDPEQTLREDIMNHAFQFKNYLLKRQVFALTGKFRIYSPQDELLLFSQQKMFKLREDIRVFTDENKSQELLLIQARNIIDFSATYDVIDSPTGLKVGTLRRKGLKSMLQDEWDVLDTQDQVVGLLFEDNIRLAMLRRFLLGSLLPQNYDVTLGQERVADLRQKFNPFAYQLMMDFSMDIGNRLDRRIGIAAAILLATIEGKQSG